jgi:hypothetical protein
VFDTRYLVHYMVMMVFIVLKKVSLEYAVKSQFNISLKVCNLECEIEGV